MICYFLTNVIILECDWNTGCEGKPKQATTADIFSENVFREHESYTKKVSWVVVFSLHLPSPVSRGMQTALYLTIAATDGWGLQVRSVYFPEVVKSQNVGPGLTQSHGPSCQRRTYHPRRNVLLTFIFTVVSFAVVCHGGQGNNTIFTCYSELKFLVMCPLGGKFTTSAIL